jgi:hypothetical protein
MKLFQVKVGINGYVIGGEQRGIIFINVAFSCLFSGLVSVCMLDSLRKSFPDERSRL